MTILSELTSKKSNPAPPCLLTSSATSRVSAREGEDALLVVYKAPGSGPIIHMSWARGSRQLVGDRYRIGENNNTVHLNLQGITKDDEGEYTVTAKNIAGESRSAVQLRVKDSSEEDDTPIFLRRLNDLSVKVGTRTRFLVEIRSSSDIKVTWYRNDLPISEEDRFHFLHEGNFFCVDVAPVTVEDGGRWACVAENQAGRSSCSCRLNVLIPKAYKAPEFIEELKAILTNQGTVSLECKVVGVPTPVLKWFKDGKELKAGDVFALTANPDDPTSLGTYTCEAVNCMGKTYSSSRVHVMGKGSREGSLKPADYPPPTGPPPHFLQELKNEKVKIGSGLTLSCQVAVPPWPRSIQWYNKEGKVESSEKYHIMEDGLGGYSIEVCPLEACDEGEWKCVARSDAGVMGITQCTVFMSYPKNYRKPKFLESLKAILTEEGLVSFECKVVGFPTPQLKWFKDGQELRPGDVYQLTGTNSLGSYSCIAKNCMGEAKSTAELTVEDIQGQLNDEEKLLLFSKNQPPRFIRGLKSCEAKINEDFRFTVQVTIVPESNLTWYKDDEKIEKTDRFATVSENLGTCHLDIKKLEITDQAEWKCVATNDFGQSVTSGFLKLTIPKHYKKPRFLECLRAILTEEGAVNLECKVIGVPQPSLKWYKDGKELKPGDIHKIISGQDGTCCLGTYTCEAHNCMGTVSSSASLLGFEDRMAIKESAIYKPELPYNLAKNTSLSTINEERTSQLYDTPMSERSVTMDERGDVSFSFDGKEVSISLYETPDLTEDEALQVVEMYAEELSEHVSEQNVVELPPLRFTKESSKSGPLLMEAVVIDVTPEYFSSAEEDLRTEADFEDVSMSEETSHAVQSPPEVEDEAFYEKINTDFLEKALAGLSSPKKPSQEKSSGSDKDSYKSLSDHRKDDLTMADVSFGDSFGIAKTEVDRRGSKKGVKKDEQKSKKTRSRSGSTDHNQSFDENVEEGVVTVVPKRKSVSRSSSGGSSDKPARKKSKSTSDSVSVEQDTMIAEAPKKGKPESEDKTKQIKRKARTSSESTEETLNEVKKQKRSKSKSVEKENVAPKAPARKKKTSTESVSDNKKEEETSGRGTKSSLTSETKKDEREIEPESEILVQSSSSSWIRKKRSSGSPSVDIEGEMKADAVIKKKKTTRSRSASRDKSHKSEEEKILKEVVESQIESKVIGGTESKHKVSLVLLKNLKVTLQDVQTGLMNVTEQIKTKCAEESLPSTTDFKLLSEPVSEIQKNLSNLQQTLNEHTEILNVAILQTIDRPLQDLKTGLKLINERQKSTEISETLEIFSLVLNHLQNQLGDFKASKEQEAQTAVEILDPLAEPIDHLNGAISKVKGVLAQRPRPDKSQAPVELLRILAQPVQELKQVIETIETEEVMGAKRSTVSLAEPINNLKSAVSLLEQYADKERPEDSISKKILQRLTKPLNRIFKSVQQEGEPEDTVQNLSNSIQNLHKELAKMVQEMLFPPQKSQSPLSEPLPALQKISQSTASILTNLAEAENVPVTVQQKRRIFSPIFEPLIAFKAAIDQIKPADGKGIQADLFSSHLQKLDSQLGDIERNLETISEEVKNEINQENLIQNVKEIRKEILAVFHGTQIGAESTWNSLLNSLQKLNLNLSWTKPRQLLKKNSSSLGKSLELIRQSSEEQFMAEMKMEEPKMSLAVLRPLEKPLQDLEEGFGLLVKHILEKERLTDEEKPAVEGQLHGLLEILSQSFESFQQKWVEIDESKKSDTTLQEANTLLELVKELHDGANAIQFQMTELENISPKVCDIIRKNIYLNLKNLTGSIAEVEKTIRKESLETVPHLKTLKTTMDNLQKQILFSKSDSKTPEEEKLLEKISATTNKLLENLAKAKYKPASEENPIWDQVVQKSVQEFREHLSELPITMKTDTNLREEAILRNAIELVDNLQDWKQTKVQTLPQIAYCLEEFRKRIEELFKEKSKPKTIQELLQVIEKNVAAVQSIRNIQPEISEALSEPLQNLQDSLVQISEGDVKYVENLLQALKHLQQGLETVEVRPEISDLTIPAEEIQQAVKTFEAEIPIEQTSEVLQTLLKPMQHLSSSLSQMQPRNTLQQIPDLIKTNLVLLEKKEVGIKPAIIQPLRQLQASLEEMKDNEQLSETTNKVLSHLVEPLKNLEKGLVVYEIVPSQITKQLERVEAEAVIPLTEIQKGVAAAQEQVLMEISKSVGELKKGLMKLVEPLEKLQVGILHTFDTEKEMLERKETLAEIINILDRDIASVRNINVLQAEDKLSEPLKALKAKLVEVAMLEKVDEDTVYVLEHLTKPLQELQREFGTIEHLSLECLPDVSPIQTFSAIALPLEQIQQQIASIETQAILQSTQPNQPPNVRRQTLQEFVQPLHDLQTALVHFIQPLQSTEDLISHIMPATHHLTEVIHTVEMNLATLEQEHVLTPETTQVLTKSLDALQAKLLEVPHLEQLNITTANILQDFSKPLKELQQNLQHVTESIQDLELTQPLLAVASPLIEVQKQFATIETQMVMEATKSDSTQTQKNVLREIAEPLHELQAGIAQMLQPVETTQHLPISEPLVSETFSQVLHLVERNIASLENKQVITVEAKEAIIEPLKIIEAKVAEINGMEKPNVKTIAVLENLAKPMKTLQEGLESVQTMVIETAGEIRTTPALTALAVPLAEVKKGIAAIEELTILESIQPKAGAETQKALQGLVEPLQKLQLGLSEILEIKETAEELNVEKMQKEKLKHVIHLVESNVASFSKTESIEQEAKLSIIKSLNALETELIEVSKSDKATENIITVLENIAEPLKKLEKGLETVEDIPGETISEQSFSIVSAIATPLIEIQKSLAAVQEQTICEIEQPMNAEEKEILQRVIKPLEELQAKLSEITQKVETTEELKLSPPKTAKLSEVLHAVEVNVAILEEKELLQSKDQQNLTESLKALKATLIEIETQKADITIHENLVKPLKEIQKGVETAEHILGESVDILKKPEAMRALAVPFLEAMKGLAAVEEQTVLDLDKPSGKTDEQKQIMTEVLEPLHKVQECLKNVLKPKPVEEVAKLAEINVNLIEEKEVLQLGLKTITEPLKKVEVKFQEVVSTEISEQVGTLMTEALVKPLKNLQKGLEVMQKERIETIQDLETSPMFAALVLPLFEIQKGIILIEEETDKQKAKDRVIETILPPLKDLKEGLSQLLKYEEGANILQELDNRLTATQGILSLIDQKALTSQSKLSSAIENLEEELNKGNTERNLKVIIDSIATVQQEIQAETVILPLRQKNLLLRLKIELDKIEQNLSTEVCLSLKKKKDSALDKLKDAVKTLHQGIENSPDVFESEEGQLKQLSCPLVNLEKAIENLVVDKKSKSLKSVTASLQDFSQVLCKVEEQIQKETESEKLEKLSQPITNIRNNLAAIEESSFLEEGLESLSESETSLLKTLADELHELHHAVSVIQALSSSQVTDLPQKAPANEKATVKADEKATILITTTDVREEVGELSDKPDMNLLKVVSHEAKELHKALAVVKEEMVLEGNKHLKELSTSILEKLAQPAQELAKAVAAIEQQTLLESKDGSISTITSPSQLETLARPIQDLHRNLAEIQQQVALVSEDVEEQIMEIVRAVAVPIQDMFRQVGAIQELPAFDSDVTTISDKLDPSVLKTLAQPTEEIKEILALVQQMQVLEPESESLPSQRGLAEVAKPLRDLQEALSIFEQLAVEVVTVSEKDCLPVIEAILKPVQDLETQMAVMQSYDYIEDENEKIKSTPAFEMLQKLATPLQELSNTITVLQQQLLEGTVKTLSEDETLLNDKRSPDTPKTISELEKAIVEQPQILMADDTSLSEATENEEKLKKEKQNKLQSRLENEKEEKLKKEQLQLEKENKKTGKQLREEEKLQKDVKENKDEEEKNENHKKEELKRQVQDKEMKNDDESLETKLEKIQKTKEEEYLKNDAQGNKKNTEEEKLQEKEKKAEQERPKKEAEENKKKKDEEHIENEQQEKKISHEEHLKKEADEKKKKEGERLKKTAEENKLKKEEESLKKEEEDQKTKEEEKHQKKEAEEKKKKELERLKQAEEEKKNKEEEERMKKEDEEQKQKEEDEHLKKEAGEKKKKEEEEYMKREAEEKKKKEEDECLKKETEKEKQKEDERLKQEAEEKKKKEEEERLKKEAEEKNKEEEKERLKKEAEEKKKEEEESLKKEAEEKKKKEEESLKKEAEDKKMRQAEEKRKEEEERLKNEEEEKKQKEDERLKQEAEEKKKKEEEERLKKEAEEKNKEEEKERLKKEAEEKKKKEEESLKKEAEDKKMRQAEEKRKEEEERLKNEEEEKKKREEEEKKKKEEEEKKKREEEEKKKKEEEERLKHEAEEKKKKEEDERLKQEAEEKKKKEEEEKKKREKEEKKKKEEDERLKKEAEEKKKKEEEERLKQEAEEKKKKEEEERLKKEAEEKKQIEEEERLKQEAEEKKKKEEEEKKKREEEEKKKKEEDERLKQEAEEKKKKEEEERMKREAEEKKKKEEDERLKQEAEEKKKREKEEKKKKEEDERLKKEAEEKKKKEEEERLKQEAEEKKKKEEEELLKKEAEEKKKKEEEERLKKEAEEKKKKEEEERLKLEAEEKKKEKERLKKEAEEKKKEEEERLKKEAEEKKKKKEEERLKKEAEEKKKEEEEKKKKEAEKKKKEEEERLKKEAEEKKKKEERLKQEAEEKKKEEERLKKEEEERLKKDAEEKKKEGERLKKEEEEKKKKEEEERLRKEAEEKKKEGERLKKEAEEKKKKKEEERLKKEAEEKKKEEERLKKEEEEKKKKEEEERLKKEAEEKKKEEERLKKEAEEKKQIEEEEGLKKDAEGMKKIDERLVSEVDENRVKDDTESEMIKEENEQLKEKPKEVINNDEFGEQQNETDKEMLRKVQSRKLEAVGYVRAEDLKMKELLENKEKGKRIIKGEKRKEDEANKQKNEENRMNSGDAKKMNEGQFIKEIEKKGNDVRDDPKIGSMGRLLKKPKFEEEDYQEGIKVTSCEENRRNLLETDIYNKTRVETTQDFSEPRKTEEGSADRQRSRRQEWEETKQDVDTHIEYIRERRIKDEIPETRERKKDIYRPRENLGGAYRSTESLRDSYRCSENWRDTYRSTESLRDVYRCTDSLRSQRQSCEEIYEIQKTHRGLLGSYKSITPSWEERRLKDDVNLGRYNLKEERGRKKKPSFCTRLTDRTASQGSTVKLTCTVLSHPEPSIQWLKDGTPIFIKSTDYTSGRYRPKLQDGIATLEIANVSPGDSGEYTCLAQNPLGEISTTSVLRVHGGYEPAPFPPTFTRPVREFYKFSEDELILECRVRSQPAPRVVWMKNGHPIRASCRYQITERKDGLCMLTIYHPEADDSGEYTCRAENAVAYSSSTYYLTFSGRQKILDSKLTDRRPEGRRLRDYQKPQFHLGLADSHVFIGGTIALQVELRGTPREVKWLRGSEELPRASSRIRSFEDSGVYTLLVSDASEKEAGTYTCRAYSSYGHVETSAAVQVVPVSAIRDGKPPKIISRPNTMMTATVEDDINFTCRVIGQPKPRVAWLKGVKDITVSERTMVEHSDDYYKFTLKRIVPADAGTYWIVAKNMHGSDRAFITVQIKQRARSLTPDPFSSSRWNWGSTAMNSVQEIRDFKDQREKYRVKETPGPISKEPFVVDSGRNWLTLSWSKPIIRGAAPVVAYRIDIWQIGQDGGARWAEIGVSPVNSFDVFNLKQGVDYKFRITPRNRYGWGEPLVTSTPITLTNKVINIPEFVKILPGQLKALLGSEIKLECHVTSDVIPSINWYRDGLLIDFENMERFTSKFDGKNCLLMIKNLREEDSGRYMCEAVNRIGRVSTFARLMVVNDPKIWEADTHLKREMLEEEATESFPPQFTMRLRDRRVQMTYPVRLTCQVLGCPPPEITWYRDGNELIQDERHAFTGEDHFYTLEISKTILEDSGCYTATAKNDSGSVSCHCNLVVDKGIRAYVAPEFVTELAERRTVKYGEELRLSAQVEAYPSVGVVWHRNGVRLRPSRRIIMTLNHDGTIEMAIAGITERESGAYTCTATNEVGRCETTCKVTVVSESSSSVPQIQEPQLPYSKAPMFITKPRSSEAVEGDTVIIDCEVVGDPKPEVFWLRDFLKPDYYRDSPHFRRQGEGPSYRLEIPHAKLDFTGTYSVVARNVHGEAKAVISLQIYAKGQGKEDRMDHSPVTHGNVETLPVFQKGLKDLRCCDGDAVTLECVVTAATTPEIRWEKGGRLLPLNNDFVASFDGKTATLTIKQVYPEDEGEYTCIASNEIGRTSTSACLVVDVPEEKENLLSRQLTRPSGLMSGASTPRSTPRTTPSRSISPYPSGYGWRESSTSSARQKRLKVAPPKFYAVPHNRIAEEGETVRFQCAVAGHPIPWVTWDKDNIVVTPSARISITEKDDLKILEIEEVTTEDAGLYRVTLENEVGRVEATARLDIMGPRGFKAKAQNVRSWSASPTFRRRLMGSVGRIGGNVTLACNIKASPTPVTSWYRNGELMVRTSRISPTWDGENSMLEIEDLEMDDAGVYTCMAENEFGKCYCSAELTVLEDDDIEVFPPVFVEPLKDVTVEEGDPAELQVRIKGSSPLDVVWVKDNREIPNCKDFRYVDYDDGRFGLRIADVFAEDSGEYICEVFNQHGEAASSAQLFVKEPVTTQLPKIEFSKKPSSIIVPSGRSASFCCRLQHKTLDTPPILVEWKIGNRIIGPDTISTKYSVEENGDVNILLIDSVDGNDAGKITCTARYTCTKCSVKPYNLDLCDCEQTVSSCSAELTVLPPNIRNNWASDSECDCTNLKRPRSRSLSTSEIESDLPKMLKNVPKYTTDSSSPEKSRALIIRGPSDVNVFRGDRVVLRATYCGRPEPEVRWLKGGKILENNDRVAIIIGEGTTSLSFDCISADDSGKYVVCIENEFGTDCHFASVAVEGPPDPPASYPLVTSIGNNSVEVEWSSPAFDGGSKITGYVVEMKNSSQGKWVGVSGLCHSLSYTAKSLQPNSKYRFRVKAENIHGQSEPSYESNEIAVISESSDVGSETESRIVTVEDSEVFKAKYEVLEELGKGRYGIVHKVADLETGQKMAAKFIRCIKIKDKEKVKEEIEIMNSLRHPKLLRLAAAFESPREIVMVMEYISGGELFERVVADDFQLTERDCILFMKQICEGVEYMHKNSVVHLDLKPENIMCQSRTSHEIKLIDFGLARKLEPDNPVRVLFGTPEFVPPEIINYEPIGFESDMWSVGVICYVLLSGLSPFMGENDAETFANITRSSYDFDDEAFNAISQDAKDFISSLLVKRKEKRLTASECLKNKWMMSEDDKTMGVILSTDKLKKFIIRRKWQKTGNAIRALGRMASLSAASRKNSQSSKPTINALEETTDTVDACGNKSSLNKSCLHKSMTDKLKTIETIQEEQVKDINSHDDKDHSKVCSERSDSGISDCSSVGSGSHPLTCSCSNAPLLNKKYSITEEEELKSCKTETTNDGSVSPFPETKSKLPKEVIGTKVDNIRKKFANLSKNIDEMDKKLENVGKKLVDIGPGKITAAKKPEIKRVPSLKDHKNLEAKKSHLMQHTASSQAKITIALKQPPTPAKETSSLTIPISSEVRTAKFTKNRVSLKSNQSSVSSPTAKGKLPDNVKSIDGGRGTKAQPSAKIQRLQQMYNTKTAAVSKESGSKMGLLKKEKDVADPPKVIHGRQSNFQETVAFWRR